MNGNESITFFFRVVHREILRISTNKVLLFTTLVAPVLVFVVVQWLFGVGVVRNLPVAIVDVDQSAVSRKIVRMVNATPVSSVAFRCNSLREAKHLMDVGETEAVLLLPADLERDMLKGTAPDLALYINNTNLVSGGLLKAGLYRTLATFSAGVKLQVYLKSGSTTIHQAYEKISPVTVDAHVLFNPFGNYSYFLSLGLIPVMLTVFTFLGSVYALGIELKEKTAGDFMRVANHNIIVALCGKFLPHTFLYLVNAMVMNLILFKGLGTPLNGSLGILIASEILLILSYQAMAVVFLAFTSNLRLSLSLGSAYTMMALTFSGLTFPSIAMPLIAKGFGYIFPYTLWLKIFLSQSLRGEPAYETFFPVLFLVFYLLLGLVAFSSLKNKLIDPLKWGKM